MSNEFQHKWGWSFLPMGSDNRILIGIAHCYNDKCGLTITEGMVWAYNSRQQKNIPVPQFGCVNPLEGL